MLRHVSHNDSFMRHFLSSTHRLLNFFKDLVQYVRVETRLVGIFYNDLMLDNAFCYEYSFVILAESNLMQKLFC